MKQMLAVLCAAACLAGPSLVGVSPARAQDTTVVRSEGPDGSRTVVKRRSAYGTTKKVVRTNATRCRNWSFAEIAF